MGSGITADLLLMGGCTTANARPTGCRSEESVNNVLVNKRMGVRNISEVTMPDVTSVFRGRLVPILDYQL